MNVKHVLRYAVVDKKINGKLKHRRGIGKHFEFSKQRLSKNNV